uniref:Uncharacterized protein n=1 Tax=Escherichia coli TaxID=562 RepID=Q3ZTY4_ECOLX|nr:Unique hypothetical protein [Escherichia coli]
MTSFGFTSPLISNPMPAFAPAPIRLVVAAAPGNSGHTIALPIAATAVSHETGVPPLHASLIAVCCSSCHFSAVPALFASAAASTCASELFSTTKIPIITYELFVNGHQKSRRPNRLVHLIN